jgi:RNA polymerase sigma factor (sigma-70 family)
MRTASYRDGFSQYLEQVSKKQLLTREQEEKLGNLVQEMVKSDNAKSYLTTQLGYTPTNARLAEHLNISESQLAAIYRNGINAKNTFIEHNIKYVISIAKNFNNRGLPLEDLIQEGSIGIQYAALKFDPSKGYKFSTYAKWWIRQSITRAIDTYGRTIRLPIHIAEDMSKIRRAAGTLSQQLGRQATTSEIDKHCKWSDGHARKVCDFHRAASTICSINRKVGKDEDIEMSDLLGNNHNVISDEENCLNAEPIAFALFNERNDAITKLLECLSPKEMSIMILRHGLNGNKVTTTSEISAMYNISCQQIRYIQRGAIQKLKKQAPRFNFEESD